MPDPAATRILVVDDELYVRRVVSRFLERAGYSYDQCGGASEALSRIQSDSYALVISDIMMPGMSGIELLAHSRHVRPETAFVMLTAVDNHETAIHALELGAYGYVIKPFEETELMINVANALRRRELEIQRDRYDHRLEEEVQARTAEIRLAQEEITLRLVAASEYRDEETGAHIRRMGEYAAIMARATGWSSISAEDLRLAAPMHDVGKIGVPDEILHKPGRLTPEEFEKIKAHTTIGAHILKGSRIPLLSMAYDIALCHHEQWTGGGYPAGLRGETIPLSARIVAVCDVYDALVNDRVYRPAIPEPKALDIMKEGSGAHFDPQILDAFLDQLPQFRAIRERVR